jgi:hypothetical protein
VLPHLAAGDRLLDVDLLAAAWSLLDRASALEDEHPAYHGSARVAVARVMLQTDRLGRCGGDSAS